MVSHARTTIDLTDIKSIEIECDSCHTKLLLDLQQVKSMPTRCPNENCKKQWLIDGSQNVADWSELFTLMRKFSTAKSEPFTLRLEISGVVKKEEK